MSDDLGQVDFAIGVVISILILPDGRMKFFGRTENRRRTVTSAHVVFGLVEMTFGLVRDGYSLSEWQAVKLTFFAP